MANKRLSMRKIREILRLKHDSGLTNRQIGLSLNISPGTVCNHLNDAKAAGISWPLPEELTDTALEEQIYGKAISASTRKRYAVPDWEYVYKELKKKSVTKQLLWQEYREQNAEHYYSYSQFCSSFNNWCKTKDLSMRQIHKNGEKLFVDYAGQTVPIINPDTGEEVAAQVFVAVLGASNYTYAEATLTQGLPDWISSHVNALDYIDGVPEIVVPDNLKSAVKKCHRYDPDLNPTYQKLAEHYGFAVIPARVRKPKDKAKAENAVQIVERKILARLRNEEFFSLGQLNKAIKHILQELNEQPFQKLPGSRRSAYLKQDKPFLKPKPVAKYIYTEIKLAKVHIDYHIEVDKHYYSVPYTLVKEKVEAHITNNTISIYHNNQRIVTHAKSNQKGRHTTLTEHMPEAHKFKSKWTPERFRMWADDIGAATCSIVENILQQRLHPEQGYRACLAVLTLAKKYSNARLENACARAIDIGAPHRKNIESILKNGLDNVKNESQQENNSFIAHDNVRGKNYYQ